MREKDALVEEFIRPASGHEMLTVTEVARLLRVHPNSVRRWANQGLITAYRIGVRGDRRFRPDDVSNFLESWVPPD
ncbi:MAG: helix-turn-helix domain-containing protein [Dehalococcoidia bacterium]